jgi:membrane protease YdiL (CAAX protease family)
MLFTFILAAHNIVRWIILVLGIIALFRAYRGWLGKQPWTSTDRKVGVFFGSALDVQLLIGIVLVILVGVPNLGAYLLEHVLPMVLAVILAHVGSVRSRKAATDAEKHKQAAIWYTIVFLVLLVAIPWYRPLLPKF